jgi:hypothetical protein
MILQAQIGEPFNLGVPLMNRSMLSLAATALLTMTASTGFGAERLHVPAATQSAASANLITRADRALRDYVAACSRGDDEAIARIFTSDAMIEYALEEPGTYLAVEADVLSANRSGNARQTGPAAHISNLSIYPTPDSNTVFVHYTTGSDVRSSATLADSEHIALLEMRGDRIAKIRASSPGVDPGTLSTLEASVVTRAMASSRFNGHN